MRVDHRKLSAVFEREREGKASSHTVKDRITPSVFQYDYLVLKSLSTDVEALIEVAAAAPPSRNGMSPLALDVGSFRCPYRSSLERRGYEVRTLDLTLEHGADFAGSAENTGLPASSVDLLLCTQVLEHTRNPARCVQEFRRIVRPDAMVLLSIPHIWFYHPHPGDYWRVTQEGMVALCEDNGFEVIELRLQGGTVMAAGQVANFVLYGIAGRLAAPIFAAINLVASALDRLLPNALFSLNVACLARRRAQ